MIKSIELGYFQAHTYSRLMLSEGVNAIIGVSDSGKTAILRALQWLLTNRPSGTGYISNAAGANDATMVRVNFDNGCAERWKAGAGNKNQYIVDGIVFDAVGTGVPEEVEKLIQMNDINVQLQMDAPFLLSKSAGETSMYFNNIIGLDVIDASLKEANRLAKTYNRDAAAFEARATALMGSIDQLDWIDNAEGDLARMEKLILRQAGKTKQYNELNELLTCMEELEVTIAELAWIDDARKLIARVEKVQEQVATTSAEYHAIQTFIVAIENEERLIAQLTTEIVKSKRLFKKEFPDICPLCEQEVNHA